MENAEAVVLAMLIAVKIMCEKEREDVEKIRTLCMCFIQTLDVLMKLDDNKK